MNYKKQFILGASVFVAALFFTSNGKLVPFGTVGWSAGGVEEIDVPAGSGVNFGGGIEYWLKPNIGTRAEFRDHVLNDSYYGVTHKWEFRFGFAL